MSVLKNYRTIAATEFEQNFMMFYKETHRLLNKVPKRRRLYVSDPIAKTTNSILEDILIISDLLFATDDTSKERRTVCVKRAINKILSLEKQMMVYSNVMQMEFEKESRWVKLLNNEIDYLNEKLLTEEDICQCYVQVLDWRKINQFKVLREMCDLHRFIHSKVVRAKGELDNLETPLIIKYIDDALYYIIKANTIIVEDNNSYEKRMSYSKAALNSLKRIQRPILLFFNIMRYSDEVQKEWGAKLATEMKLLMGYIKSDRQRYKDYAK